MLGRPLPSSVGSDQKSTTAGNLILCCCYYLTSESKVLVFERKRDDFKFCFFIECRSVAMIKSSKDTRYAVDSVVTHDGIKFPCWALSDLTVFREKVGDDAYEKVI